MEQVRVNVANQYRQAELQQVEKVSRSQIYTTITTGAIRMSGAGLSRARMIQGAMTLIFGAIYLIWICGEVLPAILLVSAGMIGAIRYMQKVLVTDLRKLSDEENDLFGCFEHVLEGFTELKFNHEKEEDLFHNYLRPISRMIEKIRIDIECRFVICEVLGEVLFFLFLGYIVFFDSGIPTLARVKIVAIAVFLQEFLDMILDSIPAMEWNKMAKERLQNLEEQLCFSPDIDEFVHKGDMTPEKFSEIQMEDIRFNYTDEDGETTFSVGPIDLTVNAGEVLFVTGGNGSGKSTLMKLLTGLYPPHSGKFKIDGRPVRMTEHRNLFAAVFTDSHLFDRIYGKDDIDARTVNRLLRVMELDHLVRWRENRFSTLDLSTGQEKRLALIIALLEDKPVYMFDEWAADQDPGFRKFFYEELLKRFKSKGKTMVVVSHDDRHFHTADRIVRMEYGRVVTG